MGLGNNIAVLRRIHGWTQEELAERSGVSVRTIRNLELERVENPRSSSVDLLLSALGAERRNVGTSPVDHAEWRGLPPPNFPLVGNLVELEHLSRSVRASRMNTFLGPGGVGKTRVALGVAAEVASSFRQGVAFVELGDIPAEQGRAASQARAVLQRAHRLVRLESSTGSPDAELADEGHRSNMLLVLDNAEHIPTSVAAAAKELFNTYPYMHILVTSRRLVTERFGVNLEVRPLSVEPGDDSSYAPAVELLLRKVGADSPLMAELTADLPGLEELCRRLHGMPRALEFAAERLRTIPTRTLLATGPALAMLRTSDHALLPHQRSVAESIRWSIGLLTDSHRRLLYRLAISPATRFGAEYVVTLGDRKESFDPESSLCLFSDLIDNSLVSACQDKLYEYRLAPYVREVICADDSYRRGHDPVAPQSAEAGSGARHPVPAGAERAG
ncbi:helix-turn-helix domain-containing protein [Plantactinospora sp. WMMC1484]|uniref:helix-turn-helix domain-containing protein n=1 Tax=Plantactinospora sp. WMMC1484 TaxID=3404122 RepID=UPI003BF5AC73